MEDEAFTIVVYCWVDIPHLQQNCLDAVRTLVQSLLEVARAAGLQERLAKSYWLRGLIRVGIEQVEHTALAEVVAPSFYTIDFWGARRGSSLSGVIHNPNRVASEIKQERNIRPHQQPFAWRNRILCHTILFPQRALLGGGIDVILEKQTGTAGHPGVELAIGDRIRVPGT